MLALSFFEILDIFFRSPATIQPSVFGLENFSSEELERNNYELVGERYDLHFYEKSYRAPYHRGALDVVHKHYFHSVNDIGNGFYLSPGLRLVSVLKWYSSTSSSNKTKGNDIELYFSDDKEEGAVIIGGSIVIRFNQWDKRGGYHVGTIESDFSGMHTFKNIATDSVRKTMNLHLLSSILYSPFPKDESVAFIRLARYLSRTAYIHSE